jgi:transposase
LILGGIGSSPALPRAPEGAGLPEADDSVQANAVSLRQSRRWPSGGISKCGYRWVRTLLYEAANVMLTRKRQLKLKDWAFAISRRSTMRKARIALARRLAIIMHAMLRDGTAFVAA